MIPSREAWQRACESVHNKKVAEIERLELLGIPRNSEAMKQAIHRWWYSEGEYAKPNRWIKRRLTLRERLTGSTNEWTDGKYSIE